MKEASDSDEGRSSPSQRDQTKFEMGKTSRLDREQEIEANLNAEELKEDQHKGPVFTLKEGLLASEVPAAVNEDRILKVDEERDENLGGTLETTKHSAYQLEHDLKMRLARLRGSCDHKKEQLHNLNGEYEAKNSILLETISKVEYLSLTEKELGIKIEALTTQQAEIEEKIHKKKTIKQAEDDRAKAISALTTVTSILGIEYHGKSIEKLYQSIETACSDLKEKMAKVKQFKENKEKFVTLYVEKSNALKEQFDQLEQKQVKHADLSISIQTLTKQKESLEKHLEKLHYSHSSLEKDSLRLAEQVTSQKSSLTHYTQLKEKEENEYNKLQTQTEEQRTIYEALLATKHQLESLVKPLQEEKESYTSELSSRRLTIKSLEAKKCSLEQETSDYDEMISKLSTKLTGQQRAVCNNLAAIQARADEKSQELEETESALMDLESQTLEKEEILLQLLRKIESHSEEQVRLNKEIKRLASRQSSTSSQLSAAEATLALIQKDIESSNNKYAHKARKLADIQLELENSQNSLEQVHSSYTQTYNDLKALVERNSHLQHETVSIEATHAQKQSELQSLESEVAVKLKELQELTPFLAETSAELAAKESSVSALTCQVASLAAEHSSLSSKTSTLQSALTKVNSHKQSLLSEIKNLHSKLAVQEQFHSEKLEKLQTAVANGESTLRQLIAAVSNCKDKLSHDKEEHSALATDLGHLSAVRSSLTAEIEHLRSASFRLQANLNELKIQEDSALVLLAVSGHKTTEEIRSRVTEICRGALELEDSKQATYGPGPLRRLETRYVELDHTALYSSNKRQSEVLSREQLSGASSVVLAETCEFLQNLPSITPPLSPQLTHQ